MTILEATGKQEAEAKEVAAGPLEEVRACSSPTQGSKTLPCRAFLPKPVTCLCGEAPPEGAGGRAGDMCSYFQCPPCSHQGRVSLLSHHPLRAAVF